MLRHGVKILKVSMGVSLVANLFVWFEKWKAFELQLSDRVLLRAAASLVLLLRDEL